MTLCIKNEKAERMARRLSKITHRSITDSIILSLEEKLAKLESKKSTNNLYDELMTISKRCSLMPNIDNRSSDEILGYNKNGAP